MPAENRPEELHLLEERGITALTNALTLAPALSLGYDEEYRFWHYPAFFNHVSWTVLTHRDATDRIIRRIEWDRTHDLRRFTDPLEGVRQGFSAPPTLAVQDLTITHAAWEALFADVASASLPPLDFREHIGIDGERWGVAKSGSFHGVSLHWWGSGPATWQPFTTRVIALLAQVETLFDRALASE